MKTRPETKDSHLEITTGQTFNKYLVDTFKGKDRSGISWNSWNMTVNQPNTVHFTRSRRQAGAIKERVESFVEKYKREIMEKVHEEINKFGRIIKIVL